MSKRRSTNAVKEETVDSFALLTPDQESPASPPPDPAASAEPDQVESVSIELPIGPYHEHQRRPEKLEARLSPAQGRKLQRLHNGLAARYGVGWSSKNPTYADVLRWLIDQLPDAYFETSEKAA